MYKKLLGTVVFALSFILSQAVLADEWGCGEGIKSMIGSLKIDEAKKEKIKALLEEKEKNMKEMSMQMDDLDKQIAAQVSSEKMDQDAVNVLVDKKTKLIGDMMKAKLVIKNQIINMLTPEQKTRILGMMKKLEDKISVRFKRCHQMD